MSQAWRRYGLFVIYLTVIAASVGGLALSTYNNHRERVRDNQAICDLARIQHATWASMHTPPSDQAAAAWQRILTHFRCEP